MKLKEVPQFIWKNKLYFAPGYGTYKEFKKPREERTKKGIIGWSSYIGWWALRIAYIGTGIHTGDWTIDNFTEYFKSNQEKIVDFEEKKENDLEKTINFEEIKLN